MIILKNVTKRYGDTVALNGLSLEIGEGELIVLKGISGSGKSTILSLIAGLNRPTEGEVIVGGRRVSKLPDSFASKYRQEMIGFIFQKYNLISNLSVEDNILTPLIPLNPAKGLVNFRIDELLNKFELQDKQFTIVKNLSGGQQQRVAIARALINKPKIILADEPTANLDEVLSQNFIQILGNLKDEGKTIIVATHDPLFFNLNMVDRIIELKGLTTMMYH